MQKFSFLNDQLLKMQWLIELVKIVLENFFKVSVDTNIGGEIHFFIYDTIKIFILLSVFIFAV